MLPVFGHTAVMVPYQGKKKLKKESQKSGARMYVFGGATPHETGRCTVNATVFGYNLDDMEWFVVPAKGRAPAPRHSHTATLVKCEQDAPYLIAVFGGTDPNAVHLGAGYSSHAVFEHKFKRKSMIIKCNTKPIIISCQIILFAAQQAQTAGKIIIFHGPNRAPNVGHGFR